MKKHLLFGLSASLVCAAISSSFAASINEIRTDQPSTDVDEYAEIVGAAEESLSGLSYLVLGDGTGGSGVIESVVSLDSSAIPADGVFVFAKSATLLSGTVTPDLVTSSLSFENSDNVTHLLVNGFTGSNGDDLDIDDDGTLDVTPWTSIVDSVALKENDSGEMLYSNRIVGPDGSFVPSHVYLCDEGFRIGAFDVASAEAKDTPGTANNCDGGGTGTPVAATIPEIQSNSASSPLVNQQVSTSGIVTAAFTSSDQLKGFFLQDPVGDNDVSTSDGIFVYNQDAAVSVGDQITLDATVVEFFEFTELSNVANLVVVSSGNTLPAPVQVTLPETTDGELEQYEGMLVEIVSPMTISQNFFLPRFGQMTLSSPDDNGNAGRLYQPTNIFSAGSPEALALEAENARRTLILDDGQDVSGFGDNPDPVPYIGKNPASVIRAGDTVSNLVGVLDYGRINANSPPSRDYRLHPTEAPSFTAANPRQSTPTNPGGSVTVASFNVLNYFTTLDGNGSICGPLANQDCRGADSANELTRQQDKIVSALIAMNADVVGLIEIENNGFGAGSAIQTLVDAVNAKAGVTKYAVLPINEGVTPGLGGDAITVGFIYQPSRVTSIGTVTTLETGAFSESITDGGRSRQPIAASFREGASNQVFTAVINHFKSKRAPSSVQGNGNDDSGDGQGSWNLRRTEAANDLADWLASDPTGVNSGDILILGDLNAYAKEDPMLALAAKGYTDLIKAHNGQNSYSYSFDGMAGSLDHALASTSLQAKVTGVTQWHINTDEPPMLDYNTEFNPDGYYQDDSFRASDHDPVIVGLDFAAQEDCFVVPLANTKVVVFCL
ncbi:ExeM/NucH family extracellular endonuclease [Arenicella xantha]|nr:ExeM/NucH family extracellular endonuclease [Arenicella xantha]